MIRYWKRVEKWAWLFWGLHFSVTFLLAPWGQVLAEERLPVLPQNAKQIVKHTTQSPSQFLIPEKFYRWDLPVGDAPEDPESYMEFRGTSMFFKVKF